MDVHEMTNLSSRTVAQSPDQFARLVDSNRSSFDQNYFRQHICAVSIRDEAPGARVASPTQQDVHMLGTTFHQLPQGSGTSSLLPDLKARLAGRDVSRTRWINVVGWNATLMNELARLHLDDHGCLDFDDVTKQMLGGPIKCANGQDFVWIQTSIWFLGNRSPCWSSVQQCGFRMVICTSTNSRGGTLITNFVGKSSLAEELSHLCTEKVLENHSMGLEALENVWILAFAILRAVAAQMDFAFQAFDPIATASTTIPCMDDLPYMLERTSNLARIDRYISGLEESSSFLSAVRTFQRTSRTTLDTKDIAKAGLDRHQDYEREALELALARQKITRAQQLCSTYMRQYENLVQMTISLSTTQLTERIERGSVMAEKFGTVGLILASLSGLTSPLGLVVGYFGMNVQEMVNGGVPSLFDFWQVALPMLLVCIMGVASIVLRLMSGFGMPRSKKYT